MTENYKRIFSELIQRDQNSDKGDGSVSFGCLMSVHQYARLYDLTLKHIARGARCLDWGGGDGHFSYFLSQQNYRPYLYAFGYPTFVQQEIRKEEIQYKQALKNEPVALPYESSSMDAVFSVGVLEHVTEFSGTEEGSLKEISRILKDNGIFICYHLPNRGSWIEKLSRMLGGHYHANTYTRSQVVALFEPRFKIKAIYRYAFFPRNSLRRLPKFIGNSNVAATVFDILDRATGFLLPWFCQNWLVVASNQDADNR